MKITKYTRKNKRTKYIGGTKNTSLVDDKISDAIEGTLKNMENITETNQTIINMLFPYNTNMSFHEDQYDILDKAIKQTFANNKTKNKWTDACSKSIVGTCGNTLHRIVKNELESTLYMVRLIYKSIISINRTTPIIPSDIFEVSHDAVLNGKWEHDKQYIKFNQYNPQDKPRLIMGFGPSASGKTYNAEQIIKIFTELDENFPKVFLSIDGGIAREQSMTYQTIVYDVLNQHVLGLSGLVTGIQQFSIFSSDKVKNQLNGYLKEQTNKISLYVPETLGFCLFDNCDSKYKKYIHYTGDERWIGLNIWQHKTGEECKQDINYPDEYKCIGCKESGENREIKEGKKYSGSQWQTSYNNGQREIMKATGGSYEIHNTGGKSINGKPNKNTFIDHTDYNNDQGKQRQMEEKIKKLGWRYCNANTESNICSISNNAIVSIPDDNYNDISFIKDILNKLLLDH